MMFSIWQGCGRIMLWKQESIHWSHCGTVLQLGVARLHHSTPPTHEYSNVESCLLAKVFSNSLLLTPLSNFCLIHD